MVRRLPNGDTAAGLPRHTLERMPRTTLRDELRAYTDADTVRTAAAVITVATPTQLASRKNVITTWEGWFPHLVRITGNYSIPERVRRSLAQLHQSRILHLGSNADTVLFGSPSDTIIIDHYPNLVTAAGNLGVVSSEEGFTVPAAQWEHLPAVPAHLKDELRALLYTTAPIDEP